MNFFGLGRNNQRTFRPKKSTPSGSKGAQLRRHIDATLGSGNLREAVRLPPGEDMYEWLAVNNLWHRLLQNGEVFEAREASVVAGDNGLYLWMTRVMRSWSMGQKQERYINVLKETKMAYKTKQEITS